MGTTASIYDLNDKNLEATEMNVLLHSELPRDQIQAKNVKVGEFKGKDVNIRTVIFGDETKPVLVFIHGYAQSGPTFSPLAKHLCQHFCFVVIDIIGMGSSSRPADYDYYKFSPEQSNNYFIDYLERWRLAMSSQFLRSGEIKEFTDFYLSGHSFGGYLCGLYSLKYHQHVKKLLLCSPIGINVRSNNNENSIHERLKRRKEESGLGPPAWAVNFTKFLWTNKLTPFWFGRTMLPRCKNIQVIRDIVIRDQIEDPVHKQQMTEYLYQIYFRKGTTENALPVNFDIVLDCYTPLGTPDLMCSPELPINVSFIYGDHDWVRDSEQDFGKKVVQINSKLNDGSSNFHICPNGTHNLHWSNLDAFCSIMINDLLNKNLPVFGIENKLSITCDDLMTTRAETEFLNLSDQYLNTDSSQMFVESAARLQEKKDQ